MHLEVDPHVLHIYLELIKRRIFIGELRYDVKRDRYVLTYDLKYLDSKHAIPLGPDLSLMKAKHVSKKGQMFPIFLDRIPERENPAYEDYCHSQRIDVNEKNPIILLGSIGRRGPSSVIFEKVYKQSFSIEHVKAFREELGLTQHELAKAFGITQVTLQKLEAGSSQDPNTLKLLEIYLTFPEVAIWQVKQHSGGLMHPKKKALLQCFLDRRS